MDLVTRRLVHFSLSLVAPGIISKPFEAFKRINFEMCGPFDFDGLIDIDIDHHNIWK